MEPFQLYPSPNGQFCLEIYAAPMRMSHEVYCPVLRDLASREVIFHTGSLWDADAVKWSADSQELEMKVRRYPDGVTVLDLVLNVPDRHAKLFYQGNVIITASFDALAGEMQTISELREIFY